MITLLLGIWEKVRSKRLFWLVVAAVGAFALGAHCGSSETVRVETHTVKDEESQLRLEESLKMQQHLSAQLSVAETTISEMKVHTTERVRIVYQKDGTTVVDKTTTTDSSSSTQEQRTSEEVKQQDTSVEETGMLEAESKTRIDIHSTTTKVVRDRFYLGLSSAVGITGLSSPGLEFKYRVMTLGKASIWAGVEGYGPLNPQVRISAGVSF
jgi:putative component of toxin-antitoxin plasmid stabilization module